MKLLRVHFSGWTSTVRIPLIVSGEAICSPVPTYPTLLGLIGCCVGREIHPSETRLGFEYFFGEESNNIDFGVDIETTHRLILKEGKLRENPKGTAIKSYEFHINPLLVLYLDNISFHKFFIRPRGIPTLGRSQDLIWIEKNPDIIEMETITEGNVNGATLMPFPQNEAGGNLLRLPEYFDNTTLFYTRIPNNIRLFQAIPSGSKVYGENLFTEKGRTDDHVIYLHQWQSIDGKK